MNRPPRARRAPSRRTDAPGPTRAHQSDSVSALDALRSRSRAVYCGAHTMPKTITESEQAVLHRGNGTDYSRLVLWRGFEMVVDRTSMLGASIRVALVSVFVFTAETAQSDAIKRISLKLA